MLISKLKIFGLIKPDNKIYQGDCTDILTNDRVTNKIKRSRISEKKNKYVLFDSSKVPK